MSEQNERAEALFDTLSQNKKKRKRKLIRTVVTVIAVVAVILLITVLSLRRRVEERFAAAAKEVLTCQVTTGTIHTTVSGSGLLVEEDLEQLSVPEGVEITEVLVEEGDLVKKGDLLATVDMASVMTAMSDVQGQIDALDKKIEAAKGEQVSSSVFAGISGRVKIIYAEKDMDVSACMAEHGALAVLSLDGYMAVDIPAGELKKDDTVTVIREDGAQISGRVESVTNGTATVLVTDNGPKYGEAVTVQTSAGAELGSGKLYIHNPLAVTGYAGTISSVTVSENASVYTWSVLFNLKDTRFSANYDSLLRQRRELEDVLKELLVIYRDGAVLAPMDGQISSVQYDEDGETDSTASAAASAAAAYTGVTASAATAEEEGETALLTLYPNKTMSVTIGIDETDILALKVDQEAEVVVSSVSDEVVIGRVTEISKVADTSTGVSQYSAVVVFDKTEGMLSGMTADVDIKIEGVENALIIPLDALHQTSSTYYVFTTFDSETQQYGGRVEVTIGMQNDSEVEILSGLKEGDTVYYTETQTYYFGFGPMGGGMGGGMGSGMGGGMPSGGMGGNPGSRGGRGG